MKLLLTSSHRRAVANAAASCILLLAVIANVSYLGHWGSDGSDHVHTPAEAQEHADHCHAGPAKCSAQQSLVGSFWVGDAPSLVTFPNPLRRVDLALFARPAEAPAARLTHPPRAA